MTDTNRAYRTVAADIARFGPGPRYRTRECEDCGNLYLWPYYGGMMICHGCSLDVGSPHPEADPSELWDSERRRDSPRPQSPPITPAEWGGSAPAEVRWTMRADQR